MKNSNYVPVRVRVTKCDIRKGEPCESKKCAIARSLGRLLNDNVTYRVGHETISVNNGKAHFKFRTPEWAANLIEVFDDTINKNNIKPRRRTMHLPKSTLKRFNG